MLTDRELELVRRATEVLHAADRNDDHTVAAAAYDSRAAVFTGVNVFHFTGGPCAEPVVMGQAAASGSPPLTTIVAVLDRERGSCVIPPCGRCRQLLFDYYPQVRVILRGENGLESVAVTDLLPHPFDQREYGPDAEPPALHVHDGYLDAVRSGRKRSTVRVHDPATPGPLRLIFDHDDSSSTTLAAVVTSVESKTADELTEADAVRDGFADLAALHRALEHHYPGLSGSAQVDVVHFELTP